MWWLQMRDGRAIKRFGAWVGTGRPLGISQGRWLRIWNLPQAAGGGGAGAAKIILQK
jgi:hypothetical protein